LLWQKTHHNDNWFKKTSIVTVLGQIHFIKKKASAYGWRVVFDGSFY
jgi:hypothetical protein